jgi:hypothetical protein
LTSILVAQLRQLARDDEAGPISGALDSPFLFSIAEPRRPLKQLLQIAARSYSELSVSFSHANGIVSKSFLPRKKECARERKNL